MAHETEAERQQIAMELEADAREQRRRELMLLRHPTYGEVVPALLEGMSAAGMRGMEVHRGISATVHGADPTLALVVAYSVRLDRVWHIDADGSMGEAFELVVLEPERGDDAPTLVWCLDFSETNDTPSERAVMHAERKVQELGASTAPGYWAAKDVARGIFRLRTALDQVSAERKLALKLAQEAA